MGFWTELILAIWLPATLFLIMAFAPKDVA